MADIKSSAELFQVLLTSLVGLIATISSVVSLWLRKKLKNLLFAKESIEREKNAVEKKLPMEHTYTVVIDGPISAGKTCLVQKLVNPCAINVPIDGRSSKEPTAVSIKTSTFWESDSWPVIWKAQTEKRAIFCIKACDGGGEKIELIPGKVREIIAEHGIVIFVIDAQKIDDATHMERFTPAYAQMGYLPDDVLRRLKGVIFFVNKIDLIPNVSRESFKRRFEARVFDMAEKFKSKGLRTSYVYGSVATEENLFRLLSEIYQAMGIQEDFPSHPDMHKRRTTNQ